MTAEPVQETVPPGVVVDGYRIDRKLGSGGQGKVYLAWRDGRPFALKFILLEGMGEWGWRELLILMSHQWPHVVRLLSHFKWPEEKPKYLVLVMEWVPGRTLHRWVEEENPTARQAARMMVKLARALEPVHAAHVLHRDLKDDNVLVREADGEPVLVDFGAGTMSGAPRVTRNPLAPADLRFRSPESVAFLLRQDRAPGERYTYGPADELYALGVIFYALLTGSYPIDGEPQMMLGEIVSLRPVEPREMNERVPRALSELCMRLLEKEPGARPPGVGALAGELEKKLREAEGEADWDVKLCHGWDSVSAEPPEKAPPAGGRVALKPWQLKWIREKPRRGRRPEPAVAPPAPPPAAPLPSAVSAPGVALLPASLNRVDVLAALLKAAVLLGVLMLAGLGAQELTRRLRPPPPAPAPVATGQRVPAGPPLTPWPWGLPTWAGGSGGEVAPPWKAPEADGAAAPPRVETPPAAAASLAARAKDTPRVNKKKQQKPNPPESTRLEETSSAMRDACLGLTGLALSACLAAQQQVPPVRGAPPPEQCPAGAVKIMTEILGLRIGDEIPVDWSDVRGRPVPVREDSAVRVFGAWDNAQGQLALPDETRISGRLYFGEKRVYGRFTTAHTPSGETYRVCMELLSEADEKPGTILKPGSEPGNMLVSPVATVRVVDHFE